MTSNERPNRDHVGRRLTVLWLCALYRRSLHLACRACPHERLLDAIAVWWLFKRRGWPEELTAVPARFYCSRGWTGMQRKVSGPALAISLAPAPPGGLSMPHEREWKKLVSRYRS